MAYVANFCLREASCEVLLRDEVTDRQSDWKWWAKWFQFWINKNANGGTQRDTRLWELRKNRGNAYLADTMIEGGVVELLHRISRSRGSHMSQVVSGWQTSVVLFRWIHLEYRCLNLKRYLKKKKEKKYKNKYWGVLVYGINLGRSFKVVYLNIGLLMN